MRSLLVLTIFPLACAGHVEGDGATDTSGGDLAAADVRLIPDAIVLEPGAPDFSPASMDDPGLGWPLDIADAPSHLDALVDPFAAHDLGEYADLSPAFDVITPSDLGPSEGIVGTCGPSGDTCGPGMACIPDDETGVPRCRFVAECSEDGAVEIDGLLDFLVLSTSFYIKVKAQVRVGPAMCTKIACPADYPCCNACYAPLVVGNEKVPIFLLGQGMTFGCEGSECDYALTCFPLKPDAWYLIWGTLSLFGGEVQLFVDSFCLAPED